MSKFFPRSWPEIILHADMDAFYASVEQRDNPELRGRPVLIGPNSHRGVVLTASYEARPFGVGSAMPVAEARRRCPQAVMVPPDFARYQQVSKVVMEVLANFSPCVEPLSLDEAFIDMSGAEHIFGSPREMGLSVKRAVHAATGLHISVGVSGTKYVAKVASALNKPNGLTVAEPNLAQAWLAPLPVSRLWGVGRKTGLRLQRLGLNTIGDIAQLDETELVQQFGKMGAHLYQLAHAKDPRRVQKGRTAKSMGSDRTLSRDISSRADICYHLRRAADRVARRLRNKMYVAHGVRVRLKTSDFKMLTRQCRLCEPTDVAKDIYDAGCHLLGSFQHPGPFRLVGLAVFDLHWQDRPAQLELFVSSRERSLEATIDQLLDRFGKSAVTRARDLAGKETVHQDGVNLDFLDNPDT